MINKTEAEKIDTDRYKPFLPQLKLTVEEEGEIIENIHDICGVYFMYVGDHFYCGRSVSIYMRAYQHQYDISVLLMKYSKCPESIPNTHYLSKVIKHMIVNGIIELKFIVMEKCERENIIGLEQKWLDISKPNKLNLNLGFEAKASSGDTKAKNKAARAEREAKYQESIKQKYNNESISI